MVLKLQKSIKNLANALSATKRSRKMICASRCARVWGYGSENELYASNGRDALSMTNQQAMKQATKRWGKQALIQNGGHFSSPDRRAEAQGKAVAARARIKEIDQEIADRLKALDWYQSLTGERRELQKVASDNISLALRYRFQVGRNTGLFFEVLGSGDTWEEAFAQADKRTHQ